MDARARRSRDRLHSAVLRMAAERPVGQVSISELAREAGVHRSTFYEHAASPVELLRQALVAELDDLRQGLLVEPAAGSAADIATGVTLSVLRHIESHIALYRRDLLGDGRRACGPCSARTSWSPAGCCSTSAGSGSSTGPGIGNEVVADLAVRLIADGTAGAIAGWLERPELSADDFLRAYQRLLPPWWRWRSHRMQIQRLSEVGRVVEGERHGGGRAAGERRAGPAAADRG